MNAGYAAFSVITRRVSRIERRTQPDQGYEKRRRRPTKSRVSR